MIWRACALCLAMFLLSSCGGPLGALQSLSDGIGELFSGKDNAEPPKELADEAPQELHVKELWDTDSGEGSNQQFVNLTLAVSAEAVFTSDVEGHVKRFDRLTGNKLWEAESGLQIASGPVYADGKLILGTRNGEVIALSETDGALVWKNVLAGEIMALPQVEGDTVVVRSQDGKIAGLTLNGGATRWLYERSVPPLALRTRGAPIIAGESVIDGFMSGKLVALGIKDGKVQWESNVTIPHGRSEVDRLIDLFGSYSDREDTVYLTGFGGGISAISPRSGESLWHRDELSTANALALTRHALFASDVVGDVWRYELSNGAALWKQEDLHQRRLSPPSAFKDYVVVGDFEGYLHFIAQDDGRLMARYKLGSEPIESAPVVYDDVLYVIGTTGRLTALSVE